MGRTVKGMLEPCQPSGGYSISAHGTITSLAPRMQERGTTKVLTLCETAAHAQDTEDENTGKESLLAAVQIG